MLDGWALSDSGSGTKTPATHRLGTVQHERPPMNIHLSLAPLIALIAGILILVMPKLLNYIVALYLIVIGLIGLFGAGALHLN
jgi:hypothetical protein